jgi:dethiobiotin synthetase
MDKIIVAGIGTDVGKTVASAILATSLQGEYWKPVQCGTKDSEKIKKWKIPFHPSTYSLKAPVSPHIAGKIDLKKIVLPKTSRPLIIESAGGIFVPLTESALSFDLFKSWNCQWVVVSRHYLGSINHTLLTLDALKRHNISVAGLIFNGEPNDDSEKFILNFSQVPVIGRLLPEPHLNLTTIKRYAKQWTFGIPLHT